MVIKVLKNNSMALKGPFRAQFGPVKRFLSVFLTLVDSIFSNLRIMIAGNGILQSSVI